MDADGQQRWLAAVQTFEHAQAFIRDLPEGDRRTYIVVDKKRGVRTMIRPNSPPSAPK